jgi:hypothetical protein
MITWLNMLKESNDPKAIANWFQCVVTLGSTEKCEMFATKIVNLQVLWIAELLLCLLGIKSFIFEVSRKCSRMRSF